MTSVLKKRVLNIFVVATNELLASVSAQRSFSHSFEEKSPNIDTNKKPETVSLWRLLLSGRKGPIKMFSNNVYLLQIRCCSLRQTKPEYISVLQNVFLLIGRDCLEPVPSCCQHVSA